MSNEIREEFEKKLSETVESEKELAKANDGTKLKSLITGRKEIFIQGVGQVIFDYPTPDVSIKADEAFAVFKTQRLRDKTLLSEKRLKSILHESGEWTEADELEVKALEEERRMHDLEFTGLRATLQEKETFRDENPDSDRAKSLDNEIKEDTELAYQHFTKLTDILKRYLEKLSERRKAFSISIEEVGYLNKIKVIAPSCIKKRNAAGDVEFLWKSEDEFFNDPYGTTILMIFDSFLRGWDISFFDESLKTT